MTAGNGEDTSGRLHSIELIGLAVWYSLPVWSKTPTDVICKQVDHWLLSHLTSPSAADSDYSCGQCPAEDELYKQSEGTESSGPQVCHLSLFPSVTPLLHGRLTKLPK